MNLKTDRLLDFDLVVGDWVKPHGKGVIADLSYFQRCTIKNLSHFQAATLEEVNDAAFVELGPRPYEIARRRIVGGRPKFILPPSLPSAALDLPKPKMQEGYELFAVRSDSDVDCQSEVRFNNPDDGQQFVPLVPLDRPWLLGLSSELKSDHLAPETGYQAVWTCSPKNPRKTTLEQIGYLRIRSKLGPDGQIVCALYGKVYGETADFARLPIMRMDYYINPDGTRNVEYDPKRNLGRAPVNETEAP